MSRSKKDQVAPKQELVWYRLLMLFMLVPYLWFFGGFIMGKIAAVLLLLFLFLAKFYYKEI
jgi:hypothetical protein